MSVREALDEFKTNNQKIKDSLRKLRDEVKREGSYKIQRFMLNDQFEEANKIMKMLEEFIGIELDSNSDEISDYINTLFVEGSNREEDNAITIEEKDGANKELSFIEREILEEIGYTSVSRLKEMKVSATEQNIRNLNLKGYLDFETVNWGNEEFLVFELTEMGKLYFRDRYGIDAKLQKNKKEEEFTLDNLEKELKSVGYEIIERKSETLEIKMENKSCYLLIPSEDVDKQMNEYYRLKNIGFICKDDEHMAKTLEQTKKWVSNNKEKSKFLAIHFTTLTTIKKNEKNPFRTIRF